MGGGAGALQEPHDDGFHDVDGREHRPPVQHRYRLLCSAAALQHTPVGRERYYLQATAFSVWIASSAEGIANCTTLGPFVRALTIYVLCLGIGGCSVCVVNARKTKVAVYICLWVVNNIA